MSNQETSVGVPSADAISATSSFRTESTMNSEHLKPNQTDFFIKVFPSIRYLGIYNGSTKFEIFYFFRNSPMFFWRDTHDGLHKTFR